MEKGTLDSRQILIGDGEGYFGFSSGIDQLGDDASFPAEMCLP